MKNYFSTLAFWRFSFWICLVAVLLLALLPTSVNIPTTGWDKFNHVFAFCVLSFLSFLAYTNHHLRLLILLLAYGGLIEVMQSFTSYRLAEWADLLADGIGICLGWGLGKLAGSIVGTVPK